MHEAGLARAVASAMAERALDPGAVVVRIAGGHAEPEDVRAALRLHLEVLLGAEAAGRLGIELAPVARLCVDCAETFEAVERTAACPACGGPGLLVPRPETLELLVADGPVDRGPDRPPVDDGWPSAFATTRVEAGVMARPSTRPRGPD